MSWKFWKHRSSVSVVCKIGPGLIHAGAGVLRVDPLPCDNLSDWLSTAARRKLRLKSDGTRTGYHPCETCGACCAMFLVSFPNSEADDVEGGFVPLVLSGRRDDTRRYMSGTELKHPRCIALQGVVGVGVTCTIYEKRPTTCHNFLRSWEDGNGNFLCDKARSVFGLQPFSQY